jgi:hypothetical protein
LSLYDAQNSVAEKLMSSFLFPLAEFDLLPLLYLLGPVVVIERVIRA